MGDSPDSRYAQQDVDEPVNQAECEAQILAYPQDTENEAQSEFQAP